jgi:RNA polymerase-associated protein CTR9
VEKHELNKAAYRDFSNQNAKIAIYYNLAAMHLGKAIREPVKEDSDKLMAETKKYLNLTEKVKMMAGRAFLTMRGFILFYEGNFELSLSSFNKSVEKNTDDEEQSVVGVLGLAQLAFAKRNYEIALNHYKKAMRMNKSLPTKARLGMAYCFYELEKYEMAKACFKRILDLDPKCVEAKIGYATLWYN